MVTYRYDYEHEGEVVVIHTLEGRTQCMWNAVIASRRFGSVYAIRNENGKDTGQRVYTNGRFEYAEGNF